MESHAALISGHILVYGKPVTNPYFHFTTGDIFRPLWRFIYKWGPGICLAYKYPIPRHLRGRTTIIRFTCCSIYDNPYLRHTSGSADLPSSSMDRWCMTITLETVRQRCIWLRCLFNQTYFNGLISYTESIFLK